MRVLSLEHQRMRLAFVWPQLRCEIRERGGDARLVCRGTLRPSPLTSIYAVRLEYSIGKPPVAVVEAPSLRTRSGQPAIPHTYPANDVWPLRPCLYYPGDGDWKADRSLATTIVPWLLEWLIQYEIWFATGEWRGGGVEHIAATIADSGEPDATCSYATPLSTDPGISRT